LDYDEFSGIVIEQTEGNKIKNCRRYAQFDTQPNYRFLPIYEGNTYYGFNEPEEDYDWKTSGDLWFIENESNKIPSKLMLNYKFCACSNTGEGIKIIDHDYDTWYD
jgi:hypothetical protein